MVSGSSYLSPPSSRFPSSFPLIGPILERLPVSWHSQTVDSGEKKPSRDTCRISHVYIVFIFHPSQNYLFTSETHIRTVKDLDFSLSIREKSRSLTVLRVSTLFSFPRAPLPLFKIFKNLFRDLSKVENLSRNSKYLITVNYRGGTGDPGADNALIFTHIYPLFYTHAGGVNVTIKGPAPRYSEGFKRYVAAENRAKKF